VAAGGAASLEPARNEWFAAGTQQALFEAPEAAGQQREGRAAGGTARIEFPTHGTILALDPDIPPQRQQLLLQASHAQVRWFMGDKKVGEGRQVQWQPWPGRYALQLRDPQGRVLDEVMLEVRGAAVKAP